MNILNSVIKLFVGDKQQKDLKGLQPIVTDVKKFEIEFSKLSNDKLLDPGNLEPLAITPFILITFIIGVLFLKNLEINFINKVLFCLIIN